MCIEQLVRRILAWLLQWQKVRGIVWMVVLFMELEIYIHKKAATVMAIRPYSYYDAHRGQRTSRSGGGTNVQPHGPSPWPTIPLMGLHHPDRTAAPTLGRLHP